MNLIQEEAIVLRLLPYGEADLVVRFLGREGGKQTGFARGARSSRRRFGGRLEMGAVLQLQYKTNPNKEMVVLLEALELSPKPLWKEALPTMAAVFFVLELADRMVPEKQPVGMKFVSICELLQSLAVANWQSHLLEWEFRWLAECGWGIPEKPEDLTDFRRIQSFLTGKIEGILGKPLASTRLLSEML